MPAASTWKIVPSGGTSIDIYMTQWPKSSESIFFDQVPFGKIVSTLYFWSTESPLVNCAGTIYTATALTNLETAAINFTTVAITSDLGSEGNFKIMNLKSTRKQALQFTDSWYEVSLELRKVQ